MPNMERKYEIDSIIPATGWKARFQTDNEATEDLHLICWALCNFEDQHDEITREIIGVALIKGKRVFCDYEKGFIEYIPPND